MSLPAGVMDELKLLAVPIQSNYYSNKHIREEIVRQVDYLPELYEDARSEIHNIKSHVLTKQIQVIAEYWVLQNSYA